MIFSHAPWRPAEGTPTRLLVLRHGEVDHSHHKHLYGQMDVELSPRGEEQSRRTAEYLKSCKIQAVYTSDLVRARYLASQITRSQGIQPRIDARLRERHFGDWQGLPWDEIENQYAVEIRRYWQDRFTTRVPGASENFHDVQHRVRAALSEIISSHTGQTVAITAHSGPVRIILAEALGLPLQCIFTFEQSYCCLNIIDHYLSGRVRVQVVNQTAHVSDLLDR